MLLAMSWGYILKRIGSTVNNEQWGNGGNSLLIYAMDGYSSKDYKWSKPALFPPPMATKWPFMTAGAGEGPGDGNLWVGRGTRQKPMSQCVTFNSRNSFCALADASLRPLGPAFAGSQPRNKSLNFYPGDPFILGSPHIGSPRSRPTEFACQ